MRIVVDTNVAACRDQMDDKILDHAVNGRADLVVSGDTDLQALGACRDIPILAPVTFLRAYYPGRLS